MRKLTSEELVNVNGGAVRGQSPIAPIGAVRGEIAVKGGTKVAISAVAVAERVALVSSAQSSISSSIDKARAAPTAGRTPVITRPSISRVQIASGRATI